jgi:NADH-quinone oxidoreductase subunit N
LAYSSIAHAGYMLIGLSVYMAAASPTAGMWDGVAALLLYLLVYAIATIGTFAALACLGRGPRQVDGVEELAGLAWTPGPLRPLLAWVIAVFMFSLAGIPPLAGFWGKLAVFASALGMEGDDPGVRNWFIALAVIGVLNAAVAAAYYLRIVGVMFFRVPLGTPRIQEGSGGALTAAVVCAVLAIVIGLSPGIWIHDATRASPAQTVQADPSHEGIPRIKSRSPAQPAPVLGDDRLSLSWPEAIPIIGDAGDNGVSPLRRIAAENPEKL